MAAIRIPPRVSFSSLLKSAINFSYSRSHLASPTRCDCGGGTSSGGSSPASYTTLAERATCEREIKKSKFIATAAPVSDAPSAMPFLSQEPVAIQKLGPSNLVRPYYPKDIKGDIDPCGVTRIIKIGIRHGVGGLVRGGSWSTLPAIYALTVHYELLGGEESTHHWGLSAEGEPLAAKQSLQRECKKN